MSCAISPPAYASYDVLVHQLAVLRPASFRPPLAGWPLPFASSYHLIAFNSLRMVTFLQRTFTSLVHAHAGRTQVAPVGSKKRCSFLALLFAAPELGVRPSIMKFAFVFIYMAIASGSLDAREVFKGLYVSAFERSDFMPCGVGEHWWLQGRVFSEIEEFIKNNSLRSNEGDWQPNTPVYIEVVGIRSEKGEWGHMGLYQYELSAPELVDISVTNKCPKGLTRQFNSDGFPRRSLSLTLLSD